MNKEPNRSLAFLLSTTLPDDKCIDDITGGNNQFSAFPRTFVPSGTYPMHYDFIEDNK
jgi:hypothetical protein